MEPILCILPRISGIMPYVILLFYLCHKVTSSTVYMDKYGDCGPNSEPYIKVEGDTYTILARGGEAYTTLDCTITFKTTDDQLCVKFKGYRMEDCEVELYIYDGNSPTGLPERYNCYTKSKNWCSSENYLTFRLKKGRLDTHNYDFEIELREKSRSAVLDDSIDTFVISIGLIIVIIISVVGVIAILAILIVCCCCKKNKHYGRVYKHRHKKAKNSNNSTHQNFTSDNPIEPTAPPIQQELEVIPLSETQEDNQSYGMFPGHRPPAYYPDPPPYKETDPPEKLQIT